MADENCVEVPSDRFLDLYWEVHRALFDVGYGAAIEKLTAILQHSDDLTEQDQSRFRELLRTYQQTVQANCFIHANLNVYPLEARFDFAHFGYPDDAERTLWAYLQSCPFGTVAFHHAVRLLVQHTVSVDNLPLARHAAQMLLHHYAILQIMRHHPNMSATWDIERVGTYGTNDSALISAFLSLPYWEAIEALKQDGSQCWIDILEISLENTLPEHRKKYFYAEILDALRTCYRNTNNFNRLEWIKAYEYE